jgi:AcrR family transcriptional regulator
VDRRDAIEDAAANALIAGGITGLTVAQVARRARVSSALVHYHFATKQKLLAAASKRLSARRTALRATAFGTGHGLTCLDAVWDNLLAGVSGDAERAWHDLVLLARDDDDVRSGIAAERENERLAVAATLPRLLRELGARPRYPADDLAEVTIVFLDGAALALASGAPPGEVRAAYDAFWLALFALGQNAPSR